jgi:hypothetical protein
MKLLRHGLPGQEKPGLLDSQGRIRDLSAQVDDIGGATLLPDALQRIAALDPASLPLVEATRASARAWRERASSSASA